MLGAVSEIHCQSMPTQRLHNYTKHWVHVGLLCRQGSNQKQKVLASTASNRVGFIW